MSYTSEHVLAFCKQNDIACSEEAAEKFDILFQRTYECDSSKNRKRHLLTSLS